MAAARTPASSGIRCRELLLGTVVPLIMSPLLAFRPGSKTQLFGAGQQDKASLIRLRPYSPA